MRLTTRNPYKEEKYYVELKMIELTGREDWRDWATAMEERNAAAAEADADAGAGGAAA